MRLYGFKQLTKALSFNIYDVCYATTPREQRDYTPISTSSITLSA